MAWQWWHTTAGGGIEVEINDRYPSGWGWRPNTHRIARNGPSGFLIYANGTACSLSPGRLPAATSYKVPQVAPQPIQGFFHYTPTPTVFNVTVQHSTRKFYLDFKGAQDTVLDLEVEVTANGTQATITNCDANKRQFQRIWPYIGLDRFKVVDDTDLHVDGLYLGVLRPYTAPATPQRDKGTCQQCGDTGEFIRMALTCRRGHGLIGGC